MGRELRFHTRSLWYRERCQERLTESPGSPLYIRTAWAQFWVTESTEFLYRKGRGGTWDVDCVRATKPSRERQG